MELENAPFKIIDVQGHDVTETPNSVTDRSLVKYNPMLDKPVPENSKYFNSPGPQQRNFIGYDMAQPINVNEIRRAEVDLAGGNGQADASFANISAGIFLFVLIAGLLRWIFARRTIIWRAVRMICGTGDEQLIVNEQPQGQQVPDQQPIPPQNVAEPQTVISFPQGAISKQLKR